METLTEALIVVAIAVLVAAIVYASVRWNHNAWEARLRGWAHDRQLHLLSFRAASFHEGPERFTRSDDQTVFHVRVCDRAGRQRTGWLLFGDRWNPFVPADELDDVFWDD
ncbi:MAG: hypothetical protein KAX84_17300 [Burkholderiales bacterium]|nr:hypothetical protein [Burkholderiales bacterium]